MMRAWIVLGGMIMAATSLAGAQDPDGSQKATTLEDQTDVAVTIYNNNLALVRDRRNIELPEGEQSLRFMDVAEQIKPETVSLQSLNTPGSIAVLEQNYEYDLITPTKLLEKYVGKQVELRNFNKDIEVGRVEATLLSVNERPVYKVDDKIFLGHPGQVVLPEIPDNLIAKPTLIWKLQNKQTDQQIEATYLTQGMSWKADYVIKLARSDKSCDISGWVTLDNQSGAQFTDAKLKVVAGEVHQAPQEQKAMDMMRGERAMAAEAQAAGMQQEAFAEYHLYTLPRRTTIKNNQSKQVSLMSATGVECEKKYEFRGNAGFFARRVPPMRDQNAEVFLRFQNEEDNNLGIPLPKGVMRVYQEDSEGMLQFAGEDRIEHTPKDEEVRIKMGEAFDVMVDRIQTDYESLGSNSHESAFEITVRNHKDSDVTVDIIEPMPSDWRVLENSHDFTKRDAHTAVFSVGVPSDGETVVQYRVRVRY